MMEILSVRLIVSYKIAQLDGLQSRLYKNKDDFLLITYTFKDDFLYRCTFFCTTSLFLSNKNQGDALFTDFKGILTEQYVLQQLQCLPDMDIHYWSADNSRGEIDFLIQHAGIISPIEVKAEENLQSKSLSTFVKNNNGLHGIRFSMSPYRGQDWMTNVPLYAVYPAYSEL